MAQRRAKARKAVPSRGSGRPAEGAGREATGTNVAVAVSQVASVPLSVRLGLLSVAADAVRKA